MITKSLSQVYSQGASNNATDNKLQDNSTNVTTSLAQNNQDKSQKEISQKIVRNFYDNVFIAKNVSAAVNYLKENYIQYNPHVPAGRAIH